MIFSCTKKVFSKVKRPIERRKEEPSLFNWYVDLVTLERKNYFLFTNSKTLFSFFVYGGTKKEHQNIETIFLSKLEEQIVREIGTSNQYFNKLIPIAPKFRFMKTNSRSIVGSMNEFKLQIKSQIEHKGPLSNTYDLINHLINKVPMGALKYDYPIERMKNELDLLQDTN